MSQTLEDAIAKIRELPEAEHDPVATALMYYVDEIASVRDRVAIQEGRDAYKRGEFVSLDQWRHDVELGSY